VGLNIGEASTVTASPFSDSGTTFNEPDDLTMSSDRDWETGE